MVLVTHVGYLDNGFVGTFLEFRLTSCSPLSRLLSLELCLTLPAVTPLTLLELCLAFPAVTPQHCCDTMCTGADQSSASVLSSGMTQE